VETLKRWWNSAAGWVSTKARWVSEKIGGSSESRNLAGVCIDHTCSAAKWAAGVPKGAWSFVKEAWNSPESAGNKIRVLATRVLLTFGAAVGIEGSLRGRGITLNITETLTCLWLMFCGILIGSAFVASTMVPVAVFGWTIIVASVTGHACVSFCSAMNAWDDMGSDEWHRYLNRLPEPTPQEVHDAMRPEGAMPPAVEDVLAGMTGPQEEHVADMAGTSASRLDAQRLVDNFAGGDLSSNKAAQNEFGMSCVELEKALKNPDHNWS